MSKKNSHLKKRPTQQDVARYANVSRATVSYVLNNTANVSIPPETRQIVLEAAKALQYMPDKAAQQLRTRRSLIIATIIPDITNPYYPLLQRGIQDAAQRQGYETVLYNTDGDRDEELRCLQMALASGVDGVIGTFFHLTNENLAPLVETGTAVVQMDGMCQEAGDLPIDRVYIDNYAASLTAVKHLIDQGHRAIAVIGAGDVLVGQERVRGYLQALTEAQITPHPGWIQMGDFSQMSGYQATQALLSSEHRPTALFAANDLVAYGALFALREHGLRIPDDMALVGYDDLPASQLISPALTSINQSQHVLGQQAVEMVLERLDGKRSGAGCCREIPFQLIVRESSMVVTRGST